MFRGELLRFVTVIGLAKLVAPTSWLPNGSVAGEKLTGGPTEPEAAPDKLATWGLVAASSKMLRAPGITPVAVGVKVIKMAQLAPAANGLTQLLLWLKLPLVTMLEIVSGTD